MCFSILHVFKCAFIFLYFVFAVSQGCKKRMTSFFFPSPGLGVHTACSRHVIWEEIFSRVMSDNYCLIGQKWQVGVVKAEKLQKFCTWVSGEVWDVLAATNFVLVRATSRKRTSVSALVEYAPSFKQYGGECICVYVKTFPEKSHILCVFNIVFSLEWPVHSAAASCGTVLLQIRPVPTRAPVFLWCPLWCGGAVLETKTGHW